MLSPARLAAAGRPGTWLSILAVALGTALYLGWELAHRGVYAYASIYPISDADEWRYTACSRLVLHGYSLFTQVFSAQPPLLFVSLASGMRVFGDSIAGARATEILFGLLALWSVAALGWLLGGRWAPTVSALLLAISPSFLIYSHTVEAEGPQMALGALALACVAAWRWREGRVWLVAAGLALAASVLTKLFAVETVAPALWLTLYGRRIDRSAALDVLTVGIAFLVPLAADFGLISPHQQWEQVVSLHQVAAGLNLPGVDSPIVVVGRYLGLDLGMSVAALAGVVALIVAADWLLAGFMVTWLGGSIAMLLLFKPLFPHHPAILAAPLAVAAGLGAQAAIERLHWNRGMQALAVLAAVGYALALPRLVHADRHTLVSVPDPAVRALATQIDNRTAPADLIAADDLRLADAANRLVVPPLCDPSNVRLQSGYLTTATAIRATRRYRPALVIETLGIYGQIRGYFPWLRRHYTREPARFGAIMFVRRH